MTSDAPSQPMPSSPVENGGHGGGVFDVAFRIGVGIRPALVAVGFITFLTIPIVVVVAAFGGRGGRTAILITGACIGAIVPICMLRGLSWSAGRRFRQLCDNIPPPPKDGGDALARQAALLDALQSVAQTWGVNGVAYGDSSNAPCRCAVELVRAGAGGKVIRLTSAPLASPAPPLDVPFEPLPLQDARPGFVDLHGRRVSLRERLAAGLSQLKALHAGRQWLYRLIVAAMFIGAVTLAVHGLRAVLALIRGRLSVDFVVIAIVALILLGILLHRAMRVDRWYLVPGGLIVLTPRLFSRWSARLLRRDECVLLCLIPVRQVVVAHADGFVDRRALSEWELDVLLRAWRSPLPPPPEGLVQGLVGQ
jgi:hypothetical protein